MSNEGIINEENLKIIYTELRKLDLNELDKLILRSELEIDMMPDIEKIVSPAELTSKGYSVEILKSIKSIVEMMNVT